MNRLQHRTSKRAIPTLCAACLIAGGLSIPGMAAALEVQPKGRLHLDYGAYDADTRALDDGLIARRAEIGIEGSFNDAWSFEVQYDLTNDGRIRPGEGGLDDISVTYEGWSAGELTLGQFKLPFGLEELTSSNNISFIERSLPVDALAPSRRMGVAFSRERDAYTITMMAFDSSLDGDDRGRGVAARLTLAPIHNDKSVLHFGVAAATEQPRSKVDFDTTPEARVADVDLVNTGSISDVTRINRVGLEGAWRSGSLSVQGEWMQARVQRDAGWADAILNGWYVAGSWVLTGESRPYKHGRFKGIEPASARGAWELTARYSNIDLDGGGLAGGTENNLTLGVNYYLNRHLRIMLNYIRVHNERRGVIDDPDILLLRTQLVW